ncbi:metallopeptidase TldD-related protein [Caldicoprobacter faecalis]|uniref:PmbA protein n=1 Tax=Caldicoprobacter faecalis TaxID=937334 RepID=A0A1I5WJK7_9FIRM|nr:metallopeptidase TldD-related protein [Caldicoprobacter faecalis]SFQ20022.1 PmbA protein [Caldicoprobacter faecalis]
MEKEFITINERETAVKIQNTRVNAVRMKDIVKKGVRVYKDGKIGISGAVGEVPDEVLIENAVQNLDAGISYPYELSGNLKDHRDYGKNRVSGDQLLECAEGILEKLRTEYSDFDFSESMLTREISWQMKNTRGLDLEYRDSYITLGLILKERKSANVIDGFLQYYGRNFDLDKFWAFNSELLEAYRNEVSLPEGDTLLVFTFEFHELLRFLSRSLNGEIYATGGSIFSNKMGEKLFNEKITIEQNMSPIYRAEPFFDMEGVVLENDRYTLIEKGRLVNVYTDKRTAAIYNLPHTGAASGDYDGMPSLTRAPVRFAVDSDDIKAALGGKMAILVAVSSGGDFTADGSFAAPVQVGFLFDGEHIIGKLPQFSIRSHLYKMLGEDYIGTFESKHFYLGDGTLLQGYYMTVAR